MFCKNCGQQVRNGDKFCEHCGYNLIEEQNSLVVRENNKIVKDSGSFWWGVLGFFIPLVGFIMYFVYRKNKPKTARSLLIGAIIGMLFIAGRRR